MDNRRHKGGVKHTMSSGNVFADLGLPSSQEDVLKAQIAIAIGNTIEQLGMTQVVAARKIGTDQAKVSAIVRGRLKEFTVDRLFNYLVALGHDVDIKISKRTHKTEGKIRVSA